LDWKPTGFTKGYTIKNAGPAQNFNFKKMPKYKKYIIITADINDGDYVTSINQISDETLETIMPVIEVKKFNFTDDLQQQIMVFITLLIYCQIIYIQLITSLF